MGESRNCKNCKYGLRRSEFSYRHDGNYAYGTECCLTENERTPYKRDTDVCEKWEEKDDGGTVD